ncbi:hypothetical protein B0A55_09837 [Friedmanniomyces simplex]|uniref:Tryptophan synthase beta chain-like PALP domain-containing protein n=1 Tax=Friedmanniomyces simplex TaxID=329884 RepID=A0A4U0WZ25_9PEZI|nr:hypothetical protein B0A55_09837 [Friedmanniomyces simplex]
MPTLQIYQGKYLWRYVPSLPLAITFATLFGEVIGYATRAAAYNATGAPTPYIIQAILLVLAPVFFAASLYMVYSRVVQAVHGERFSLLTPRRTTIIFVSGDVLCLNIQSLGSGLLPHPKTLTMGTYIVVAGLGLQILMFACFMVCCLKFNTRFQAHVAATSITSDVPWQSCLNMLYATSLAILLRNIYRVVEFVMGKDGYLNITEWPAYAFDGALMILVMVGFFLWYPTECTAKPRVKLFFKCENQQRIGAFKARGAFHALGRLIEADGLENVKRRGVVTHSSGNHAQALALAAATHGVQAHIVMPSISTPSKIAGTKSHGANVIFSGSTSVEREAVVADVVEKTGATLVHPYNHPDIILGQGTQALELEEQVEEILSLEPLIGIPGRKKLDAIIAPVGGGGMLSGICTAMHGTGIKVFGAEPRFEGANDAEQGLKQGKRVENVKTLTIADGLRTPVGEIPWSVITDKDKLAGIYSVTEEQIKAALRLAMERAKLFIEPSAAVPLAVMLYNEDFRKLVKREAGEEGWNVGIILSGGNTTMEAIAKLFEAPKRIEERAEAKVTAGGERVAENVAG